MFIFSNKTVQSVPWNKGKLTSQKPPLLPKHVWAIRTKLHLDGRVRDLALFNLAIDSKLRGCDVVSLRAGDVAPHGYEIDRAMVRQRKTGRPVKFEIAEHTRQAVDNYLRENPRTSDEFLFIGWKGELLSKVGDGGFQAARSISFSPSLNLTPSTISARR